MTNRKFIAKKVSKIVDSVLTDMEKPDNLYERREGQENIMYTTIDSFEEKRNKIIEAGVGIGKSFGYLIPGVLFSHFTGEPLIVATSTIQLTEQLSKDVKIVGNILSPYLSGRQVEYVVGKGQTNYPCLCTIHNRFAKTGNNVYLDILKQIGPGVDRQNPNGIDNKYWDKITVHECSATHGFDRNACFLYQMRSDLLKKSTRKDIEKKFNPRVLIVNQDFLINHYKNKVIGRNSLLPDDPCLLVIDEVHNLEEKTREALTAIIKPRNILNTLDNVVYYSKDYKTKKKIINIKNRFSSIFKDIENDARHIVQNDSEIFIGDKIPISNGEKKECNLIRITIKKLIVDFSLKRDSTSNRSYLQEELNDIISGLEETLVFTETYGNLTEFNIIWAKMKNNKKIEIYYCPGNIGETLNDQIFSKSIPSLCTSATITMKGNDIDPYEYIKTNIGFSSSNGDWEYMEESPFHYEQSRLFIPKDLPSIKDRGTDHYYEEISLLIDEIYSGCNGGCVVLLTSKNDMIQLAERLKINIDTPIYIDDESMTPKQIISRFEKTKGIILSAGSFWEGIDLKGDLLTNLIVVKLPYPVSDPVIQNKMNRFNRDSVLLSEMISKLRQGTGRLIRTSTDIGVVSILDSRMVDSNYNNLNTILESLPFKVRVSNIEKLKRISKKVFNLNLFLLLFIFS